jgi:hypothetical protein
VDILHLAAEAGGDPLGVLLQYGPLGAFAILLILYTKSSITREQQRTERCEQQVKELNDYIRSELLPKQVQATLLHQQVAEVLAEAVEIIAGVKMIERNERRRG